MPSCAALGCFRQKGMVRKYFPRKDRRRRQIWVDMMDRPGWIPNKTSFLCEVHFDKDQWEMRNGKRKLKSSAIPTIFPIKPTHCPVPRDHPYCLPYYRKFVEDGTFKTDKSEDNGSMHIEHIKVEMGENEDFDFTKESVEEGISLEGSGDSQEREEEVESIQCTPDILAYPERGEPYPIEMVNCEMEYNTSLAEPERDPLAFSAEDKINPTAVHPLFGTGKKYLFIPRNTKAVVHTPDKATGEPIVGSTLPTNNQSSARLKVKSIKQLIDPKTALETPTKSPNLPPFVDSKQVFRSPSAVYIKEPLTLTAASTKTGDRKSMSPVSLVIDKDIVTLTSPKFNSSVGAKVTPTSKAAPPKLNLVTTPVSHEHNLNFFQNTKNRNALKVFSKIKESSNPLLSSSSKEELSKLALQKNNYSKKIFAFEKKTNFKCLNPQKTCPPLKKAASISWKMLENKEVIQEKNNSPRKTIRNNDGKHLVQKNQIKRASIIILKPYGSPKNVFPRGNEGNIKKTMMYKCARCNALFTSKNAYTRHKPCNFIKGKQSDYFRAIKKILQTNANVNVDGTSLKRTNENEIRQKESTTVLVSSEDESSLETIEEISSSDEDTDTASEKSENGVKKSIKDRNILNQSLTVENTFPDVHDLVSSEDDSSIRTTEEISSSDEDTDSASEKSENGVKKSIKDRNILNQSLTVENTFPEVHDLVSSEDDSSTTEEISSSDEDTDSASEKSENGVKKSIKDRNILNQSFTVKNTFPKVPDLSAVKFKSVEFLKKSGQWGPRKVRGLMKGRNLNKTESKDSFNGNDKSVGCKQMFDESKKEDAVNSLPKENPTTKIKKNHKVVPTSFQRKTRPNKIKDDQRKNNIVVISSSDSSEDDASTCSLVDISNESERNTRKGKIKSSRHVPQNSGASLVIPSGVVDKERLKKLITLKKDTELIDKQQKTVVLEKAVESFKPLKTNDFSNKPTVMLSRHNTSDICKIKTCQGIEKQHSPENNAKLVPSDDKDIKCRGKTNSNKITAKPKLSLSVCQRGGEKTLIAKVSEEEVVDLTQTDQATERKQILSEKPIISRVPKLRSREIKTNDRADTNSKKLKIGNDLHNASNMKLVLETLSRDHTTNIISHGTWRPTQPARCVSKSLLTAFY
ncbi:uncharacterized protein LOC128999464 [Macrosteles quadrilineatus]|uniref:uncharacterized protein LOC128999464 n=1 Tax=Macrosteles quadrilineatus TaxID=74068 RepID=UPI0023E1EA6B|nr:uncharacterized protein LOC128999464 [Macrosteles quadrilineatus]